MHLIACLASKLPILIAFRASSLSSKIFFFWLESKISFVFIAPLCQVHLVFPSWFLVEMALINGIVINFLSCFGSFYGCGLGIIFLRKFSIHLPSMLRQIIPLFLSPRSSNPITQEASRKDQAWPHLCTQLEKIFPCMHVMIEISCI